MNQILQTDLNYKNKSNKKLKFFLKLQLYFSIFFIIVVGFVIVNYKYKLYKQEQFSNDILNTYNITKLYSNNTYTLDDNSQAFNVLGIIEIPKINIYYPVFSNYDEDLLKISPCRFYGPLPGKNGNLCIAGHNYDNDKFFSKIVNLSLNDEILLYNNYNKKFSYFVSDIYEVKDDDFSPIYSYNSNSKQLTLITCNNLNNNRIIVKALL